MRRSAALAAAFAVITTVAGSAGAAPSGPCRSFPKIHGPASYDEEQRARAAAAPVVKVSDRNDEQHPLEVRYTHAPGGTVFHQTDVLSEFVFHTVQVATRSRAAHLWVRAEFSEVATDIDLYAYSARGTQIGYSESSNNAVEDTVFSLVFGPSTGGPGFELIEGAATAACSAVTIETENSQVLTETPVRLLVWLGPRGSATG